MLFKFITFTTLFLAITSAALAKLDCGDEDVESCKTEFVRQIDTKIGDHFLVVLKQQFCELIIMFDKASRELPANSQNAKLLKDSIKSLKEDLVQYELNKNNYVELRNITNNMERNTQPHVMHAPNNQRTIADLEQLLEKYHYRQIMEHVNFKDTMRAFGKYWQQLFYDLRISDLQEYPQYSLINAIAKQLQVSGRHDDAQYLKLSRELLRQVRNFCKIPFLETMVFGDGELVKV